MQAAVIDIEATETGGYLNFRFDEWYGEQVFLKRDDFVNLRAKIDEFLNASS